MKVYKKDEELKMRDGIEKEKEREGDLMGEGRKLKEKDGN